MRSLGRKSAPEINRDHRRSNCLYANAKAAPARCASTATFDEEPLSLNRTGATRTIANMAHMGIGNEDRAGSRAWDRTT